MKKDRLTERDKYGHAYFPECFEEPCLGCGCAKEPCELMTKVCEKLAKYETKKILIAVMNAANAVEIITEMKTETSFADVLNVLMVHAKIRRTNNAD